MKAVFGAIVFSFSCALTYGEYSGYFKFLDLSSFQSTDSIWNVNTLHHRINLSGTHGILKVEAGLRNLLHYGQSIPKPSSTDPGFADMTWVFLNKNSLTGTSQVDRAWAEGSFGEGYLRLGRQRINWGMSLVWNPNDILNVYNFFDYDYEERHGMDAVKAQYYFSGFSSLEAAYSAGKSLKPQTWALRWYSRTHSTDYQLVAGLQTGWATAGFALAGNLGNASLKTEASYFYLFPDSTRKNTVSLSASLDYFFPYSLYGQQSFLWTSSGMLTPDGSTLSTWNPQPYALMPSVFSLLTQLNRSMSPLFQAGVGFLYDLPLHFLVVLPSISFSIGQNWMLNFYSQAFYFQKNSDWDHSVLVILRLKWSY